MSPTRLRPLACPTGPGLSSVGKIYVHHLGVVQASASGKTLSIAERMNSVGVRIMSIASRTGTHSGGKTSASQNGTMAFNRSKWCLRLNP